MKLTIQAGALAAAAGLAVEALDPRTKIPACQAIRLKAADELALGLNNLDQAIDVTVPGEIETPGECAPPAAALAKLAAGFPTSTTITLTADAQGLSVQYGRSRYRLSILPVEDIPAAPEMEEEARLELSREAALRMFARPQFAISREETRYYLNGIYLRDAGTGVIDAVATDGQRLAVVGVASDRPLYSRPSKDRSLIVPKQAATLISKLLRVRKPAGITLRRSKTLIQVVADGFTLTSKLIDASYPEYERLIPGWQQNTATTDRTELIKALQRLAAVAAREAKTLLGAVGLEWAEGDSAIRLSLSRQPDAGADLIDAELTGSARIAFNVEKLIEQIEELEGARVRFDINDNGAGMITDPGDEGLVTLLMQCRW